MENKQTKKVSLITKLTTMVTVFGVISLIMNGAYTYITQTVSYRRECESNLRKITSYMQAELAEEGEDFKELKKYFEEHHEDMLIPVDFGWDYRRAKESFEESFRNEYPGKIPGRDVSFAELTDEVKRAYALYRYEYWFSTFHSVADKFNLVYTYFLYPLDEPNMCYMIDPMPDVISVDGKDYFTFGATGPLAPEKYPMMWESWHTQKSPTGFDVFDNEYGHNYAYYAPLVVDGEGVGLIGAEIAVASVNSTILSSVLTQIFGYLIILTISISIMVYLSKREIINRLLDLTHSVAEYSENKDPAVAGLIREREQGNDEIRSLSDNFADMIVELKDYMDNLQFVTAEKERIGAELNVATQIQADMLPRIFPTFSDKKEYELFATMDPAKEVGGDFYDFFMIDDDHLGLVVADVSGKGVPAALFMVIAKTLIKNRALMGGSPSEVLSYANEQLCEGNDAELFVTVWFAIIDIHTGKGIAANAGHEHPAIKRSGGEFELSIYKHSVAVATMEGIRFREHEFEVHPGDILFCYTDGVTEATDSGNNLFGNDRLLAALNKDPNASAEGLCQNVKESIDEFVGKAPQFDDITMLCIKFT